MSSFSGDGIWLRWLDNAGKSVEIVKMVLPQRDFTHAGDVCEDRIANLLEQYSEADPQVCTVRAKAVTKAFTRHSGLPSVLIKALAFKEICETMPVIIYDNELVVGSSGTYRRSAGMSPELSWQWVRDEIEMIDSREQDPYTITPDDLDSVLHDIIPFWRGKSIEESFLARLPEDIKTIGVDTGIVDNDSKWRCAVGEVTPDFRDILFVKGFEGIIGDAEIKLAGLDMSVPDHIDRIDFYKAVIICAKAVICIGERYGSEAERLASIASTSGRREELLSIAAICKNIPRKPPKSFREAIQMVWFVQLANSYFENAVALNIGRFDQFMFPYYQQDLDSGVLTEEQAQELINCLWIKLSEWVWFVSKNTASFFAGYNGFQNLTIGGRKPDGTDGTNAISYMCLEATRKVKSHQPGLSVRIHPDCPHEFILAVCDLIKEGTGFPAVHNDRVGTQMLSSVGLAPQDAMDWSNCGCVVPHSTKISEWTSACNINLAAALEFVLSNGKHVLSGSQMSPMTGTLDTLTSFEQVQKNYFRQLAYMIRCGVTATLIAQQVQAEKAPRPLFSSFTEGCLETGKDVTQGGAKYNVGPVLTGIGIADAANSLAAIKHLVFDEKITDLGTLCDALAADWGGFEDLHQKALACPKFGNDDDYVDQFAVKISNFYHQEISGYTDIYGSSFNSAFMGISNYIPAGKAVGATPCGRMAGEPLTEGCSAHAGTDTTSPTAAMRSTAKIQHGRHSGGTLLNIKLAPSTLRTRADLNKLANLIRGYFELDAFHVQFNVFDKETLLEAQKTPEKYKNLLVRVAGYSARFTTLSKEVQDAIIERTSYTGF